MRDAATGRQPPSPSEDFTMNRQDHRKLWDQMRLRHGITLRVLEQLSAEQLTSRPIAGMRTPIELVVHMYATVEEFAAGVPKGVVGKYDETATVAGIKTGEQLQAYVKRAWAAADRIATSVTDPQLGAPVKTPWGDAFSGHEMFGVIYDEYLHHRGQLYAFVRVFGIEPVMVWDFEHNAAEFQPGQPAQG
jgi:uncharacterized damage-inducible protein DinB